MISALICALVGLGAILLSGELGQSKRRALALSEEIYSLLSHIKRQISCYLCPLSELIRDYSTPELMRVGFIKMARERGLLTAVRECEGLRISDEERKLMISLFSSLGSGYASDEVRLIEDSLSEFYAMLVQKRSEIPKDIKLINTLCASGALGILILMI